jgi:DNA-binding GntR family transcriptional regulator
LKGANRKAALNGNFSTFQQDGTFGRSGPRGRLADTAYSSLRGEIESGALAPGAVLYELDLVERLSMSRTPVREALHRLCTEGYLAQQYRGYMVVELTNRDLANVYRVRGVLEGMAARQAAAARSRVDIAILQDFIDRAEMAIAEGRTADSAEIAEQFHDALAKASGNNYLYATLMGTRRYVEPYRKQISPVHGLAERALAEHKEILATIERGDGDAAEFAAREHTRRTLWAIVHGGEEQLF